MPEVGYPYDIPGLQEIEQIHFHKDVTFIVGENGSGKSTILEAIAMNLGLSPEGGTENMNLDSSGSTSSLHQHIKAVKGYKKPAQYYFLRAESFFNVATYMDETAYLAGYGGKSLHEQSHGESFLALLNNKLTGKGLYLFDEPEAALSPMRQLSTLSIIDSLVKKQSQLIIATHSPIIMSYPNSTILQIDGSGIHPVHFTDTEHYKINKLFFEDYENMLHKVLSS